MKAQFVYERLDFERGQDPKGSMKIGRWVEKEMKEIFDFIVDRHKGTYTVDREYPLVKGFYKNDLFGSGGRYLVYNLETGRKFMTWPGSDAIEIDIQHPDEFINEVDKDLYSREETVKKLGYNPYQREYAETRP